MNTRHPDYRASVGLVAVIVLVIGVRSAHAYIDPGSGGMLMQLLIGGLMGGLVLLRSSWQRIRGWFQRRPADRKDGD